MAYVIIGVILLLIVVPLFSVLPSRRQRAQMVMRKVAMRAGVSVRMTVIDDPNPQQDIYLSSTGKRLPARLNVAAYQIQRRRSAEWRAQPKMDWCAQRELDAVTHEHRWRWTIEPPMLMSPTMRDWLYNSINQLPADVEQVEDINFMITIYWHERDAGDELAVIDFLKTCNDLLACESTADKFAND